MTIYFIGDGEHIKIGYTKGDARKRLAQLQTGNSRALRLLATVEGGPDKEVELHQQFDSCRLTGEWFAVAQEDLGSIDGIQFAGAGGNTAVASRTASTISRRKIARPSWDPLKAHIGRLEKEADDINGQGCRALAMEWFKEAFDRVQTPSVLALVDPRAEERLKTAIESNRIYRDFPEDMKQPVVEGQPWTKFSLGVGWSAPKYMVSYPIVNALNRVFQVDPKALAYKPSTKYYRHYRQWFSTAYVNDESWDSCTKEISRLHGNTFITQRDDAFWDYIDNAVVWASLDGDRSYLRLEPDDCRKYFNELVLSVGMGKIKRKMQQSFGQYLSEYEAALGFYDWSRDYCMGAEYNEAEDEYRIRT